MKCNQLKIAYSSCDYINGLPMLQFLHNFLRSIFFFFFSSGELPGPGGDFNSPRDGSLHCNASLFGFANGTASGIAPKSRIAIYKACCYDCVLDCVRFLSISLSLPPVSGAITKASFFYAAKKQGSLSSSSFYRSIRNKITIHRPSFTSIVVIP